MTSAVFRYVRARLQKGEGGFRLHAETIGGAAPTKRDSAATEAETTADLRELLQQWGMQWIFEIDDWHYFSCAVNDEEVLDAGTEINLSDRVCRLDSQPQTTEALARAAIEDRQRNEQLEDLLRQGLRLMPLSTGLHHHWHEATSAMVRPLEVSQNCASQ